MGVLERIERFQTTSLGLHCVIVKEWLPSSPSGMDNPVMLQPAILAASHCTFVSDNMNPSRLLREPFCNSFLFIVI
jgi:hypothetical protein